MYRSSTHKYGSYTHMYGSCTHKYRSSTHKYKINHSLISIAHALISIGRPLISTDHPLISIDHPLISIGLYNWFMSSQFLGWVLYPIRNLSKGQRCGSLEFIGRPTITIEGHPRFSNYFQSFPIQEVPLSRYWHSVGYANIQPWVAA